MPKSKDVIHATKHRQKEKRVQNKMAHPRYLTIKLGQGKVKME